MNFHLFFQILIFTRVFSYMYDKNLEYHNSA